MALLINLIISYLVGSIPTAYIFGRVLKGIDIRKHGSGNVGATNALRILGKGPGAMVLVIDVLKGFLPILILSKYINAASINSLQMQYILLGVAAICGHSWPVFLQFKGGKGIATTLGVLLGLSARIEGLGTIIALLLFTWLACFVFSKIVSISSILAAIALPIFMFAFKQSWIMAITSIFLSAFVIYRHKTNIIRFLQGKEHKLKF